MYAEEEKGAWMGGRRTHSNRPPLLPSLVSNALISGSAAHFIHTLNTRTNGRNRAEFLDQIRERLTKTCTVNDIEHGNDILQSIL